MIVVLGRPGLGGPGRDGSRSPAGLAAEVALAVAARGGQVELAGGIGDDDAGDRVAVALGRAGVGHAALLRDPAGATPVAGETPAGPPPRLDAADVELGLRYLPECGALVVVVPLDEAAAAAAMAAAAYHGARVVAMVPAGSAVPPAWEGGAIVLTAPDPGTEDEELPSRLFATFLATLAIALEAGAPEPEALRRAAAAGGWERAG